MGGPGMGGPRPGGVGNLFGNGGNADPLQGGGPRGKPPG